jgi:hypothetical protein
VRRANASETIITSLRKPGTIPGIFRRSRRECIDLLASTPIDDGHPGRRGRDENHDRVSGIEEMNLIQAGKGTVGPSAPFGASMWLKGILIGYAVIWALYFSFSIYIHRDYIGTDQFAPYVWKTLQVTGAWPYYLFRGR